MARKKVKSIKCGGFRETAAICKIPGFCFYKNNLRSRRLLALSLQSVRSPFRVRETTEVSGRFYLRFVFPTEHQTALMFR